MKFQDFMNSVRQLDNRTSQWFVRHFYVLFFEVILVAVFVLFFANTINVINIASDSNHSSIVEKLLITQNTTGLMVLFLLLLNSFWMLFMFSGILRIRGVLRNIDFNLSRRPHDKRRDDND